jgi:hypothetical protein
MWSPIELLDDVIELSADTVALDVATARIADKTPMNSIDRRIEASSCERSK